MPLTQLNSDSQKSLAATAFQEQGVMEGVCFSLTLWQLAHLFIRFFFWTHIPGQNKTSIAL